MDGKPKQSRVDPLGRAFKGSRLQIQTYANVLTDRLNEGMRGAFPNLGPLTWVSPLASEMYTEYLDEAFLSVMGLPHLVDNLAEFWPRRGPNWDALAVTGDSVLLVEAKSYPAEAKTRSGASEGSLEWIKRSLLETANWLGLSELPRTWWDGYYQGANRLAHLYFLREACGIEAYLAFVNFVDDPTHNPTAIGVWEVAEVQYLNALGLDGLPPAAAFVYLPGVERAVLTG